MGNKDFGCGFWEIADGRSRSSTAPKDSVSGRVEYLTQKCSPPAGTLRDSGMFKKDLVCLKIHQKNTQIELNKWDLSTNQHFTNTFVDERSYCNCEKYYKILSNYRDFLKKIGIF